MSEIIVSLVFLVGIAVCLAGGLGITAVAFVWAIDKTLNATGTMNIVAQWWLAKKFPSRFNG